MRKAVTLLLSFAASFSSLNAMETSSYFPNDPRLFSSKEELRRLVSGPDALHWVVPDSEVTIGESEVFVVYTSEGSGLIHEFAYVYQCDKNDRCILVTTAHAFAEGNKRLRHLIDRSSRSITFWLGTRKILTAKIQPQ